MTLNTVAFGLAWAGGYSGEFGRRGNSYGVAFKAYCIILVWFCVSILMRIVAGHTGEVVVAIFETFAQRQAEWLESLRQVFFRIRNVGGAAVTLPTHLIHLYPAHLCPLLYIVGRFIGTVHRIDMVASCTMASFASYAKKLILWEETIRRLRGRMATNTAPCCLPIPNNA